MLKKMNKKGFTLAELLIVVAIIAVLVAISIPIFSAQLEKAKEATDMANIRSAYAEVVAAYLGDSQKHEASVDLKSHKNDYVSDENAEIAGVKYEDILSGSDTNNYAKNPCVVKVAADGTVTINDKPATTSNISGN